MKKIMSFILVAVMLFTVAPFTAFAGGDEIEIFLDTPHNLWLGIDTETFKFTPTDDGWYNFSAVGDKTDTYATLYNSNWDEIAYCDDTSDSFNFDFSCKLYAGYTYYIEVGAYVDDLESAIFDLIVTETVGVEEATITKEPDNTNCIIGYEELTSSLAGMEVTFTLSNGEEVVWSYDKSGTVVGETVEVYLDSDGYGHYYIDVVCGEGFDRFFYDMIENPVESISVYSMDNIEMYEYSHGYYSDGDYIYDYYLNGQIQINYTDGTSEIVSFHDETPEGAYFNYEDDQVNAPWGVGDNKVTIKYLGKEAFATVKILPCPYESVNLISAPSRTYIYGDTAWGYIYDGDYVVEPYDLTGLSFELGYSDSTKDIIDADDIDMDLMEIDGYMYDIGEYIVAGPCDLWVTLSYKGMDISYNVEVVESPVESIEVLKAPDKYEYEDRYYADYLGMEVKVNYKDGTNETVVFSDDNMQYVLNGSFYCQAPVKSGNLIVQRIFDIYSEEYYTVVSCLGARIDYFGINYTDSRDIASIIRVENFSYNTDGMTVYIEYESGVEEYLTYSPVDYYDYGDDMYEGFSMTENGVAYFDISLKSKDETSAVYSLYTLNNTIEVEIPNVKLGDVDGDGNIAVMDATLIQRYLAQLDVLTDAQFAAADVNKDLEVNVMDATIIQRFVAKIITEF